MASSLATNIAVHVLEFKVKETSRTSLTFGYGLWWAYVVANLLRANADVFQAQGFFAYPPTIVAAKLRHRHLVYDLIDFVADSFDWSEPVRKVWAWCERFCASLADGLIVVDLRKQDLGEHRRVPVAVVPNCPDDLAPFGALRKSRVPFRIYYGGAIFPERGIADVGDAISEMPDVELDVAGIGPAEGGLRERFSQQPNVRFLGQLSEKESLRKTLDSDLVFALYDPRIRINRRAVSAKLFDAMMCAKPVLVNAESELHADLVGKEHCGTSVPYGDVEAIRNVILYLRDNPGDADEMGKNGRRAYEREFNWPAMQRRLANLYQVVLGPRATSVVGA